MQKSHRGDRMSEHQSYVRIMSDILDSGVWAKLSPAGRALYPVLLRFTDYNFRYVWPNTETLMRLTGFRTKKSIVEAKRDLEQNGLIFTVSGSGRTSTRFYFRFDYEGSKITPLGDTSINPRGPEGQSSGVYANGLEGVKNGNPNHINITINNTQDNKSKEDILKDEKDQFSAEKKYSKNGATLSLESLLEDYGAEVFHYAYQEAKKRELQNNLPYIKTICRNRISKLQETLNIGQKLGASPSPQPSWFGFLEWAKSRLSSSSYKDLQELDILVDGDCICIQEKVTASQRTIIERYFSQEVDTDILVVFASPKVENRIF